MGPVGFEHTPLKASKILISTSGGAKSDALDAPKTIQDSDIDNIVKIWPELPRYIKAAINTYLWFFRYIRYNSKNVGASSSSIFGFDLRISSYVLTYHVGVLRILRNQ